MGNRIKIKQFPPQSLVRWWCVGGEGDGGGAEGGGKQDQVLMAA